MHLPSAPLQHSLFLCLQLLMSHFPWLSLQAECCCLSGGEHFPLHQGALTFIRNSQLMGKQKKKNRLLLSYKADWCYLQMKEKLQHLRRLHNKWKLENRSQKITDKYYPVNSFVCSMYITVSAINIHLLFEICFHYMSPCVCVCWGGWSESPLGLVVQWYGLRSPARHTRECTLNCPAFSPTL